MTNAYLQGLAAIVGQRVSVPQQMRSLPNADGGRTVDGGGPPLAMEEPLPAESVEVPAVPSSRYLESELDGVDDEAWTEFVLAMKTQEPSAVSASNEYGMFALKPRRLADLGLVKNLSNARSGKRMVWVGDWVPPLTEKLFLATPRLQYKAFAASMQRYATGIADGSITMPDGGRPEDMTLSGALAILHRAGPSGLKTWGDEAKRFPATIDLYAKVNGTF